MIGTVNAKNVDIMGYIRGAHEEGEHICDGFVFTQPGGRKNAAGDPIYGWNDIEAVRCAKCGARDDRHVLLGDINEEVERRVEARRNREQAARTAAVKRAADAKPALPAATPAVIAAAPPAASDPWLLDESTDPLSVLSGAPPKPKVSAAYSPYLSEVQYPPQQQAQGERDPFKEEVERMVRESLVRGGALPPPADQAPPNELQSKLAAAEAQLAMAQKKLAEAGLA